MIPDVFISPQPIINPVIVAIVDALRAAGCIPSEGRDRATSQCAPITPQVWVAINFIVRQHIETRFCYQPLTSRTLAAITGELGTVNRHLSELKLRMLIDKADEARESGVYADPGWHDIGTQLVYDFYVTANGLRPSIDLIFRLAVGY